MRINYERVMQQANQISNLGGDLEKIARELRVMMETMPNAWQGSAAQAYLSVCEDLKNRVHRTSSEINAVSQTIKTTAQRIHNEDLRMSRRRIR